METKHTTLFSQLYHSLHLFHPPDLFLSQAFSSLLSILLSSIVFVIIVSYQRIITMKKLMNLDHLACYCHYTCFVSVDTLSAGA